MPLNIDEILDSILHDQRVLMHIMQQTVAPEWLQLDLTMPQLKVLFALCHQPQVVVGNLGQALDVGLPAASVLVDRLVQQGLVERSEDPADRRRTVVRLTPKGDKLITHLWEGSRERVRGWISRMDETDVVALAKGISALANVAAADPATAKPFLSNKHSTKSTSVPATKKNAK